MKIEIDTNLKPPREQAGTVLGHARRVWKTASGVLVLTPAGEFVSVNERGIKQLDKADTLPALIKAAREAAKLTQEQLAQQVDSTRAAVVAWETARRAPSLITVMGILWVCGLLNKWPGIIK